MLAKKHTTIALVVFSVAQFFGTNIFITTACMSTSMIAAGAKEQQTALRDLLQELANPSADRDEDEDEDENEDSMKGAAKVKEKAAKLLSQLDEEE